MKLKLADNLSLPVEVVTQTVAILAKRRAGKSYTMRRLVEQLHRAGQQVVLVDPKGDQWGVRSAADGKGPGLPIVILGGERGDVKPLEAGAGEIVAKLVVEERVSALLDLSLFRKHEVATFMAIFLENLYRLKAREQYRTPLMLVIDEADAIAPQKPQKGEERMLGAAEDIVRRGGQRGIGCVLVSQRSAVLNKNVLTQAQILVVLRTIAPQDLAALDAWIDVHGTENERKTLMASLPALPVGDAWFWSPGWPTVDGIFKRVHVLPIETFDSGATPKPGEKRVEPKSVADVDLDALKRQMAATIEKAKAEDPRELRKQIAEKDRELARTKQALSMATGAQQALVQTKTIEKPVLKDGQLARAERIAEHIEKLHAGLREQIEALVYAGKELEHAIRQTAVGAAIHSPRLPDRIAHPARGRGADGRSDVTREEVPEARRDARVRRRESPSGAAGEKLPPGETATLIAAAQYPDGVVRDQLSVLTGYKRSSRDTYIQRLLARAYVTLNGDGTIVATDAGITALGSAFEPLPEGDALRAWWLDRLPPGEMAVLDVAIRAYPQSIHRDAIDEATGYKRSSRDTYIQRLVARRLVTTERGGIRASNTLFG